MAQQWFVCRGESIEPHPIHTRELKEMAKDGRLSPHDWVRQGPEGKWVLARHVRGLFSYTTTRPNEVGTDQSQKPTSSVTQTLPPFEQSITKPKPTGLNQFLAGYSHQIFDCFACLWAHWGSIFRVFWFYANQHRLNRARHQAMIALGEAMLALSIGDLVLRQKIRTLETSDKLPNDTSAVANSNRPDREKLLSSLVLSELPDPIPPELEYPYRNYSMALNSSRLNHANRFHGKGSLVPSSLLHGVRLLAGYLMLGMVVACFFLPSPWQFLSDDRPAPRVDITISNLNQEKKLKRAVGLVVVGFRGFHPDGRLVEVPIATGSCFAVASDGYLLTNRHVINDITSLHQQIKNIKAKIKSKAQLSAAEQSIFNDRLDFSIWVYFGRNERYNANVLYRSDQHDVAVLKVKPNKPLSVFSLQSKPEINRTQRVFALGYPWAANVRFESEAFQPSNQTVAHRSIEDYFKRRDFDFTSTAGTISRLTTLENAERYIQTDATIHPGNSGGPLITDNAIVLGINTFKHQDAEGISFTLEASQLRQELAQVIPALRWIHK